MMMIEGELFTLPERLLGLMMIVLLDWPLLRPFALPPLVADHPPPLLNQIQALGHLVLYNKEEIDIIHHHPSSFSIYEPISLSCPAVMLLVKDGKHTTHRYNHGREAYAHTFFISCHDDADFCSPLG